MCAHHSCTEFFPQYNAYEALNVTSTPDLGTVTMSNRISQYLDGRILGEECAPMPVALCVSKRVFVCA